MNEELIRKVKFFNLGNPNFVFTIARHLYPKTCQDGEIILRAGEIAEEMFFIKSGKVEVLASDYDTGIAILEEGAYFGEIGLLITGHRTVSIRALSNCVFACLSKEKFETFRGPKEGADEGGLPEAEDDQADGPELGSGELEVPRGGLI